MGMGRLVGSQMLGQNVQRNCPIENAYLFIALCFILGSSSWDGALKVILGLYSLADSKHLYHIYYLYLKCVCYVSFEVFRLLHQNGDGIVQQQFK